MAIRCCPKCGASNYKRVNQSLGVFFSQDEFVCNECGYAGIFVEVDNPKQFKKQLLDEKSNGNP